MDDRVVALREQAARCLRLSQDDQYAGMKTLLLEMADEYDAQADAIQYVASLGHGDP